MELQINSVDQMHQLGAKIGDFIHIDTYRLLDQGVSSFSDLDFESYLENSIFVIEWGASFVNTLNDQYLEIIIKQGTEESFRNISFNLVGDRWSGFNL